MREEGHITGPFQSGADESVVVASQPKGMLSYWLKGSDLYCGNGVMSPNELHKFNEQNGGILLLHTPPPVRRTEERKREYEISSLTVQTSSLGGSAR